MSVHLLAANTVAAAYLAAFISILVQWHGLWGANGLIPAAPKLSANTAALDLPEGLLAAISSAGFGVDGAAELVCCCGILAATMQAVSRRPNALLFLVMAMAYLILISVGGAFTNFQWDILLVEVGWAMALSSPLPFSTSHELTAPGRWLLRFCAFKLLLMAGAVKLQAECPTWSALSATEVHYASQCIPSPAAWWWHQLPPIVHRLEVAATMLIELPATLLLLSPFDVSARVGVWLQVLLQLLIIITGNYNFFNVLTIALCLFSYPVPPLLVECNESESSSELSCARGCDPLRVLQKWLRRLNRSRVATTLQLFALTAGSAACCAYMFEAEWVAPPPAEGAPPLPLWHRLELRMHPQRMSPRALDALLDAALSPLLWAFWGCYAGLSAAWLLAQADRGVADVVRGLGLGACGRAAARVCCRPQQRGAAALPPTAAAAGGGGDDSVLGLVRGLAWGVARLVSGLLRLAWAAAVVAGCAVALGSSSTMLLTLRPQLLNGGGSSGAAAAGWLVAAYHAGAPLRLSSGYGLFRRMTGVGPARHDAWGLPVTTVARPELVLEGRWLPQDAAAATDAAVVLTPAAAAAFAAAAAAAAASSPAAADAAAAAAVWLPIELPYKPGDVSRAPRWNAPHQPRLDWQMWFAALGGAGPGDAPWLARLADLLLEGAPAAYGLLDAGAYPVRRRVRVRRPASASAAAASAGAASAGGGGGAVTVEALVPPLALRVLRFEYDFTRVDAAWARGRQPVLDPAAYALAAGGSGSGNGTGGTGPRAALPWWQRRLHPTQPVYMGPLSHGDASLDAFCCRHGWARPAKRLWRRSPLLDAAAAAAIDGTTASPQEEGTCSNSSSRRGGGLLPRVLHRAACGGAPASYATVDDVVPWDHDPEPRHCSSAATAAATASEAAATVPPSVYLPHALSSPRVSPALSAGMNCTAIAGRVARRVQRALSSAALPAAALPAAAARAIGAVSGAAAGAACRALIAARRLGLLPPHPGFGVERPARGEDGTAAAPAAAAGSDALSGVSIDVAAAARAGIKLLPRGVLLGSGAAQQPQPEEGYAWPAPLVVTGADLAAALVGGDAPPSAAAASSAAAAAGGGNAAAVAAHRNHHASCHSGSPLWWLLGLVAAHLLLQQARALLLVPAPQPQAAGRCGGGGEGYGEAVPPEPARVALQPAPQQPAAAPCASAGRGSGASEAPAPRRRRDVRQFMTEGL